MFTSVSSSGYYRFHDLVVGMSSGSGLYQELVELQKIDFGHQQLLLDTAIGLIHCRYGNNS